MLGQNKIKSSFSTEPLFMHLNKQLSDI